MLEFRYLCIKAFSVHKYLNSSIVFDSLNFSSISGCHGFVTQSLGNFGEQEASMVGVSSAEVAS
jgi:hypothetical protein